jgi:predicted DsbA family dithiol-disulfide isomerase
VEWRPFDLHPEYPREGLPRERLNARYGEAGAQRIRAIVESAGYPYAPPQDVVPRSLAALQVTEMARDAGHHEELHERLMAGYWSEGRNIGDVDVLVELGGECGLEADAVRDATSDPVLARRVEESTRDALSLGISGVPGWLVDGRLLIPGAQPHEVFERALSRLGHEAVEA